MNVRSHCYEENKLVLRMQKNWPLGVIGFVGFWKIPEIHSFFSEPDGSWWALANVLWFSWFLYFLPEEHSDDLKPGER